MMTASQERQQAHAEFVRSRDRVLPLDVLPANEILESWNRCSFVGLKMDTVPEISSVSGAELSRRRDAAGVVRHLALTEIEMLSQQIAGSNFLLAFGDQDGVILDVLADQRFAVSASGARIAAGSRWGEDLCGTNGLGTALVQGRSVSINGPDHFFFHFGDISCTATPVRDAWGLIVGVLDASSYFESRQRHTEALVKMAAAQIENSLLAYQMHDALVLAIHPRAEFLATVSAGVMAFSPSGALRCANARAHALLAGLSLSPGTWFEDLFDMPFEAAQKRVTAGGVVNFRDAMGSALVSRAYGAVGAVHPSKVVLLGTRQPSVPPLAIASVPLVTAIFDTPKWPVPTDSLKIDGRPYLAVDSRVEAALRRVSAAVRLNLPLLIHGETGSGKEQLARYAHEVSGRKGAFVAVNCGALAKDLFESELFGYKGGAFTGARREDTPGLLVSADGGTLLLDELGELPRALQPALLRFLDDQFVRPVGATQGRRVDVQIVGSTHVDLEAEVVAGRFRADLMYRLNTVLLALPPLRERQDFADIVRHVLYGLDPATDITRAAIDRLAGHSWPGNFRELRSVLARALMDRDRGAADMAIEALGIADISKHLPADKYFDLSGVSALNLGATDLVLNEFKRTGYNISLTSRNLAISRTTVYRHLRQCNALPAATERTLVRSR